MRYFNDFLLLFFFFVFLSEKSYTIKIYNSAIISHELDEENIWGHFSVHHMR